MLRYLFSLVTGEDLPYVLLVNDCRTFSAGQYEAAKKKYPKAQHWERPSGLRMNDPNRQNVPGMWVR
jgi:hypothetical protein